MEKNDIYTKDRRLTGQIHLRGTPWRRGEYGLVVCVWVYDDAGRVLLTRRAPEKTFAGTWENSGGAAQAGENSLQAIVRELREETGICAEAEAFTLIDTGTDHNAHFDYYALFRPVDLEKVVLLQGETDDVRWVTLPQVHEMIGSGQICRVIARQFLRQEPMLRALMDKVHKDKI